jgi:rod shape-determining protein MreD
MKLTIYIAVPLMLLLVVLQAAVLPRFPVLGVAPQLLLLVVLAWTLLHGLAEGMLWALVAGLLLDLFSTSPLGVTTLAMMAAMAVAALIQRSFPGSRLLLPIVLAFVTTAVFWTVNVFLLRLLIPLIVGGATQLSVGALIESNRVPGLAADVTAYYGLGDAAVQLILATAAVHAVLIVPIFWAFRSLDRLFSSGRVEI